MALTSIYTLFSSENSASAIDAGSEPIEFKSEKNEEDGNQKTFFETSDGLILTETMVGKFSKKYAKTTGLARDLISSAYFFCNLKKEEKFGYKINLHFKKNFLKDQYRYLLSKHPDSNLTLTEFAERLVIANETGRIFMHSCQKLVNTSALNDLIHMQLSQVDQEDINNWTTEAELTFNNIENRNKRNQDLGFK